MRTKYESDLLTDSKHKFTTYRFQAESLFCLNVMSMFTGSATINIKRNLIVA